MLLLQLLQLLQQLLQLQAAAFGDKNYDSEDSAKSVGGVGSGRGIGLIKNTKLQRVGVMRESNINITTGKRTLATKNISVRTKLGRI